MLNLTLRPGEKLHIGEAVLTVTRKGQQFGITVKAPLSVHVYRERVLEQLREMLSGKEVANG